MPHHTLLTINANHMKNFSMRSHENEIISITSAWSLEEAVEYFSTLKVLPREDFLKIFNVIEDK